MEEHFAVSDLRWPMHASQNSRASQACLVLRNCRKYVMPQRSLSRQIKLSIFDEPDLQPSRHNSVLLVQPSGSWRKPDLRNVGEVTVPDVDSGELRECDISETKEDFLPVADSFPISDNASAAGDRRTHAVNVEQVTSHQWWVASHVRIEAAEAAASQLNTHKQSTKLNLSCKTQLSLSKLHVVADSSSTTWKDTK